MGRGEEGRAEAEGAVRNRHRSYRTKNRGKEETTASRESILSMESLDRGLRGADINIRILL
jgi:hypothetical protein